jgi:membrane-bound lytic murein transglycosylase B
MRGLAIAAAFLCVACAGESGSADTTSSVASVTTTEAVSTTTTTATSVAATTTTTASTSRITLPLTATDLAGQLTTVERAAEQGDGSVGVRQQLLYRYLAAHPELDDAVLAAVGDDARPFVERIVRARQLGQARQAANPSTSPPSDTLPAWTVAEPLPADELLGDYRDAEAATGIPWYWLAAIHLQETRMGRIVGTSSAGAVGPMQFLPETWARCCTGDPTITRDAIIGAATYLSQSGGPGDMQAAVHVYNPSDTYVATVTAFAENMRDNPQLYAAYRQWQVFYASSAGTVRLPTGYTESQPIDAAAYLADHPADAAS